MSRYFISKSIEIDAPIEKVHASVRDFKQWPAWSPWLIAEPGCPLTFAEDGSSYGWEGSIVGTGSMEVTDEEAPHSITYRLSFLKPMKAESVVQFKFAPKGEGTEVTWTMDGKLPFYLFWMAKMMTTLVGMDYDRGLTMLKDHLETGSVPSKLEFPGIREFGGCSYIGIKRQVPMAGIGPAMQEDLAKLGSFFEDSDLKPSGRPFSIYEKWCLKTLTTTYTIGLPVPATPPGLPEGFLEGTIPSCRAYVIEHTGPYKNLGNAWSSGIMHGRSRQFRQNKKILPFEVYENDPRSTDENDLLTSVHFPAR